jgi:hypothetical protein
MQPVASTLTGPRSQRGPWSSGGAVCGPTYWLVSPRWGSALVPVIGANGLGLMKTDKLSLAQIAEIGAQQLAEDLESQYWAQLAETNVQRARAMAEFHSVSTKRESTGSTSSGPRTWSPSIEGGREKPTRS